MGPGDCRGCLRWGWGVEPLLPCAPIMAAARWEDEDGDGEEKEEGDGEAKDEGEGVGKEEGDPCQLGPPLWGAT